MSPKDNSTGGDDRTVAVALKQESGGAIPRVSASGRGDFAKQLIEIALASGVKIREDADLAEILTAFEVDSPIPIEAFDAVAEILGYVYRANGDESAARTPRHREWLSEAIKGQDAEP